MYNFDLRIGLLCTKKHSISLLLLKLQIFELRININYTLNTYLAITFILHSLTNQRSYFLEYSRRYFDHVANTLNLSIKLLSS